MHSAIDRERQEEARLAARERTAAATAGRMRASENRHAARLEARGWLCIAPEQADAVRALLKTANPR